MENVHDESPVRIWPHPTRILIQVQLSGRMFSQVRYRSKICMTRKCDDVGAKNVVTSYRFFVMVRKIMTSTSENRHQH